MKKIVVVLIALFAIMPNLIFAEEQKQGFELLVQEEKYYKTTYYNGYVDGIDTLSQPSFMTEEITQDEYNSYNYVTDSMSRVSSYISTEYKKMTISILSNGSYYRYKVVLDWKKMPKIRSYDIIGIGHNSNVKIVGTPTFNLKYCTSSSNCTTSTSSTKQTFSNGAGASFKLPSGTFVTMQATYFYDVAKSGSSTLYSQTAYGDYSHATSSVTASQAMQYSVNNSGIVLDSSITNSYDTINTAAVSWSGTW